MENENEDEKNNLTLEKNDERSDVNVENDETTDTNVENGGTDYAYCMYEEPNVTRDEYDLTNIERDRFLRVRQALEENGLVKTEINRN